MDGLRRETQVAHDRDLRADDRPDHVEALSTALKFHGTCATLLDEPTRIANGLLRRRVEGQPRHVTDDERVRFRACDRCGVVDHHVDSDSQSVVISEHDIGDRISDEDGVCTRSVGDSRSWGIIRRNHLEFRPVLTGEDRWRSDLCGHGSVPFSPPTGWGTLYRIQQSGIVNLGRRDGSPVSCRPSHGRPVSPVP